VATQQPEARRATSAEVGAVDLATSIPARGVAAGVVLADGES
jgi:hypothetical protein